MTAPTQQIATQEATIDRLRHELGEIRKRDEHAQAYIPVLKEKIAHLEAQLSDTAKADWILRMTGHD